jgi:hypothetical protein
MPSRNRTTHVPFPPGPPPRRGAQRGGKRVGPRWARSAVLTLIAVGMTFVTCTAAAQTATVNGTIDASIDGEARRWTTLYVADSEEGAQSSASFHSFGFGMLDMTVQGHLTEGRFQVAGALSISAMLMAGIPSDCPCTVPDPEILWFAGTGMFEDVYQSITAELVLDVVETVGESAWRVEGSFSGVLAYIERVGMEPDESKTVTIEGTFAVDPMILEGDGE